MQNSINNEKGSIMLIALLIMAMLTILGLTAVNTAVVELRIAHNEQILKRNFYNAETGIIDAINNATKGPNAWLTEPFLIQTNTFLSNGTTVPVNSQPLCNIVDTNGNRVATIEIRCIEPNAIPMPGFSQGANSIPALSYEVPPPAGSGFSMKNFKVLQFAVTSTTASGGGGIQIQTGAYKVFSK
ncbi:MAG: pilus assembly PilX N-terminal domain-containing protein [Desulfobacterales bacterium]|nr:pilus assembly PilX N-terminal domain-containing protein [Desulfobacterales bacterium]